MATPDKTKLSLGGVALVALLFAANWIFDLGLLGNGAAAGTVAEPADPPKATQPAATPSERAPSRSGAAAATGNPTPAQAPVPAEPALSQAPAPEPSDTGFTSARSLAQHFEKHGHEFEVKTAAEYLAIAQRLRDAPLGGDVIEATRDDGVVTRFDRDSGAFVAFNADRTIRTLFKPDDGERYFVRQSKRDD